MTAWLSQAGTRLLLALLRVFSKLPYGVVRATGSTAGALLYWLVAPRRRVARVNLRLCLPELDDAQRDRLAAALSKATGKRVEVKVIIDEKVLGGLVARVGDTVIDGTIRHRLEQLKETI